MTKNQILFNYNQSISKAKELENVSNELRRIAQKDMENSINNLSGAWKGKSASEYLNIANTLQKKIESSSKELNKTADKIRRIAENIKNAELQALAIAEARTYGKN